MKKRVLLHADSLIRDPAYLLVLAELLKRRGIDAVVSSRVTTGFYLRFWKPHVLVHSQAHTVRGHFDQGLIDEARGPLVIFVPQEGNNARDHTLHRGFRGILDEKAARFIHRIYHYNEWHVDWFAENSAFRADQLICCGNPRLDLVKFSGAPDARPSTGRLGFIGRFPSINKHEGLSVNYFLLGDFSHQSMAVQRQDLSHINRQVNVLYWYGQLVHRLLDETDFVVSMRPHHEERRKSDGYERLLKTYGRERFSLDNNLSIFHWANSLDAAIGTTSLTAVECYLAKTPFLCIDHMAETEASVLADNDEAPMFRAMDERLMPQDPDHFMEIVDRIRNGQITVERSQFMDDYLSYHFSWPYPGSVLATITDGICEALDIAPGQPSIPYAPSVAGDLFFLYRTLQQGGLNPGIVTDKNYNTLFHRTPPFVQRTADNICGNGNMSGDARNLTAAAKT